MGCDDQGNAENLLNQAAREKCIPRMAVNNIRFFDRPGHEYVQEKTFQQFLMAGILKRKIETQANPFYLYIANIFLLIPEAKYMNIVSTLLQAGEFTREVFDMNSGSPISVGRIFISEQGNFHQFLLINLLYLIYLFIEPTVKPFTDDGG
jgi:hypothetical protein